MTSLSQLDWDKNGGLLPAVIQDVNSGAVLTGLPNPYTVTLYNVQLPVLIPGSYPNSSLSGAAALP